MQEALEIVKNRGQDDALQAVSHARQHREVARANYREAVLEAHRAGLTYTAIASAAGVSLEAVRMVIRRQQRTEDAVTTSGLTPRGRKR